jgi:hypothetical protein
MNQKSPNMNESRPNIGAGKGSRPRNCFSDSFKENYDSIKWLEESNKSLIKKELKNKDGSATYIYK